MTLCAAGLAFNCVASDAIAAHTKNILITGYWPPTNEMVRPFSANPTLNPDGWIGQNWENRGYNIYSHFPTFSNPNCTSCGAGMGELMVDYQDTSTDFWPIANAIQPVAIVTFSRTSSGPNDWICEINQRNLTTWSNDYIAPMQPTPAPPDAGVAPGFVRISTLPVQNIFDAMESSGLPIIPEIDWTGNGGGFVSEFIAYHGVWYQSNHQEPRDPAQCVAAGHVHVGSSISWINAHEATKITLREVLDYVDALLAAPGDVNLDGAVNVADLLGVITQWGPCPPQPSGCPADLNDSGSVDVADLLDVIVNWS